MAASDDDLLLFRFGVYEMDRRTRELRRQGARIRLQDQPFQVLGLLLERAGDVVTREQFREVLWPGSVFVDFDHGLNNAIGRLREALGDSAAAPRFIETLPRLGYRFIYPVERIARDARGTQSRWVRVAAVTATVFVVAALAAWVFLASRGHEPAVLNAERIPSVAVVPFVNLGPEQDDQVFADGLSAELITKLATIRGLMVAGQTSSFHFKGSPATPVEIARTLNVDHLLEGNVRRSDSRLRVTAQLIDPATGHELWAATFDRHARDAIEIQEDIARAVANALQVKLLAADETRLRKRLTDDPEAYRLYLLARAQISWVFGRPDWGVVRRSYEEAIHRDPGFAAAYAGLSHYLFNFASDEDDIRAGREAAERAVSLDPDLGEALGARANWEFHDYLFEGDYGAYQRALEDYRLALELDPQNALVLFHYGRAVLWSDPPLALRLLEETARIDPVRFSAVGLAALLTSAVRGQHDAARRRVHELYENNPERTFHTALSVATLETFLGRLDEAAVFLNESLVQGERGSATQLWGLYMSLGDLEAALQVLPRFDKPELRMAAAAAMSGRHEEALAALEHRAGNSPSGRWRSDFAAARLALIVGRPEHALAILESRLPDLASGTEPIDMRNVLPALDLAAALLSMDRRAEAHALLARIDSFLGGPSAPRWPMYVFLRARAHALEGDLDSAQRDLDLAYEQGFRMTWAVDIAPRPFGYIDPVEADPAFARLRADPRFRGWLERISADNARQLGRLTARQPAASPRSVGADDHEGSSAAPEE